jgi:AbrB family looped-hinge helix DNA binding protein
MLHTDSRQKVFVDATGQIRIPTEFCKALGINEGDELIATLEDDQILLQTRQSLAKRLRGILKANDARDLTSELLEERCLEAKKKGF